MNDTSKPAYPQPMGREPGYGQEGMTLREHYAGQIMAATIGGIYASDQEVNPKATARFAVECADALLAALETP